jgi:hypothetical protein
MSSRCEIMTFAATLAGLVGIFLAESLFGGKVLSPGDVVFAEASFAEFEGPRYEPRNRLLMDPVLQFQPWLEFNRAMLRSGRLPLWNSLVGCGAPHLANGQSAVFDPFHLIAYFGRLPVAHAWMAAARFWVAGLGMFLLMRRWGAGVWGRWFAGLLFPFCGFLVLWLLYPVTSVAIWMPWLFWATDRLGDRASSRNVGVLALVTACVLLGGHIQTSAHVLLATGAYATWRSLRAAISADSRSSVKSGSSSVHLFASTHPVIRQDDAPVPLLQKQPLNRRYPVAVWALGIALGISVAAIEILPLAVYLTKSPVWNDRANERLSVWQLARPRVLDSICTLFPYAYGSQRRGHPNLAKALGVHNLNEAAGGFPGVATCLVLAPAAFALRRRNSHITFVAGLVAAGGLAAFEIPPLANLLRFVPVLNVMDHRRLTLWVAFGLVALGGFGLDRATEALRGQLGVWVRATAVVGALLLLAAAPMVGWAAPTLRAKANAHYGETAAETPGADPAVFRDRAERQVQQVLQFIPRYALFSAANLLAIAGLVTAARREWFGAAGVRLGFLLLTITDVFGFGFGLNPAIARSADRPASAVIAYLRRETPPPSRILGIGAELPPNVLMRYGLADLRNYDSVELTASLDRVPALYERGRARTSRRTITWDGVIRAREALAWSGVAAIVGASPPPRGAFTRTDRVGDVWVARLTPQSHGSYVSEHGCIRVDVRGDRAQRLVLPETYDPGWSARADRTPLRVGKGRGNFLEVTVPAGAKSLVLRYDPVEVRVALVVSTIACVAMALALAGKNPVRKGGKNRLWSWKPSRNRVRIESVISSLSGSPASH